VKTFRIVIRNNPVNQWDCIAPSLTAARDYTAAWYGLALDQFAVCVVD
jgi:hypothetical protein